MELKKTKFIKKKGKLNSPLGAGIMSGVADAGLEMFIQHGIPFMGKKLLEAGKYYASEALREPIYQKKAATLAKKISQKGVNYAIDALSKDLLNTVSTKIRPKGKI